MKRKSKTVIFFVCIILISFLLLKKRNIREKFDDKNGLYVRKTSGYCTGDEESKITPYECLHLSKNNMTTIYDAKFAEDTGVIEPGGINPPNRCFEKNSNTLIWNFEKPSMSAPCSEKYPCICRKGKIDNSFNTLAPEYIKGNVDNSFNSLAQEAWKNSNLFFKKNWGTCEGPDSTHLNSQECKYGIHPTKIMDTVTFKNKPGYCYEQKSNGVIIYNYIQDGSTAECSEEFPCWCKHKPPPEKWMNPQRKKHMESLVKKYNIEDMKKWEKENKIHIMKKDPANKFLSDTATTMSMKEYPIIIGIVFGVLCLLTILYTFSSSYPNIILISFIPILWVLHLIFYFIITIIATANTKVSPSVDYYHSEFTNSKPTETSKRLLGGSGIFLTITVAFTIIINIFSKY